MCSTGPRAARDYWREALAVLGAVEGNGKSLGRKDAAWWRELEEGWGGGGSEACGEPARDKAFWRGLGRSADVTDVAVRHHGAGQ